MLFIFSKIIGFFLNPKNIIFLLSVILSLSVIFRLRKLSKIFSIILITVITFISYLPLPYEILRNLEDSTFSQKNSYMTLQNKNVHYINYDKKKLYNLLDGVLVLGGGTGSGYVSEYRNEALLSEPAERLTKAVELFQTNNSIKIIFSGYSGDVVLRGWPEYKVAKKFFLEMGVPEKNLILEKKSRNTFENIFYSKKFFSENEIWGLVTSAHHMKRAFLIAKKLNIDNKIIFLPVDFRTAGKTGYFNFNLSAGISCWSLILHEYVGILYYYFLGRV